MRLRQAFNKIPYMRLLNIRESHYPPFEGVFSCEYASKQMRIDSLHVNRLRNIHVVRDYMLYHFDWIGHCFLLPRRQDVSGQGHPRSLASSVDISTIVYAKFRSCQGAVQKTE